MSKGTTPKKTVEYRRDDPSSYVPLATPSRQQLADTAGPLKSSLRNSSTSAADDSSRPKTSRGSRNPPPDDYYNYVVPSPNHTFDPSKVLEKDATNRSRVQVHSIGDDGQRATARPTPHALTEKDVYIGCWLFGSLLRV